MLYNCGADFPSSVSTVSVTAKDRGTTMMLVRLVRLMPVQEFGAYQKGIVMSTCCVR
jgi:hypothetical protein